MRVVDWTRACCTLRNRWPWRSPVSRSVMSLGPFAVSAFWRLSGQGSAQRDRERCERARRRERARFPHWQSGEKMKSVCLHRVQPPIRMGPRANEGESMIAGRPTNCCSGTLLPPPKVDTLMPADWVPSPQLRGGISGAKSADLGSSWWRARPRPSKRGPEPRSPLSQADADADADRQRERERARTASNGTGGPARGEGDKQQAQRSPRAPQMCAPPSIRTTDRRTCPSVISALIPLLLPSRLGAQTADCAEREIIEHILIRQCLMRTLGSLLGLVCVLGLWSQRAAYVVGGKWARGCCMSASRGRERRRVCVPVVVLRQASSKK